ncbi:MAG: hypothetical protein H0T79_10490, partial [Deltaproteobacteria bacterium]|nr:hypothetical protein [Deltaproteobacteria bacterium]
MRRPHRLLAGVAVAACLVLVGGALGLISPRSLAGASGWSAVVLATLFGYGALGRRVLHVELGPGEQLAVGTIAWIAVTGVLLAVGVASRIPLLVLAAGGVGLAFHDLVTRARAAGDTGARWSPAVLVLVALLGIYLLATIAGWVGSRGNPYDDHVAYTGLVKRVLDCGDLVEPFSFRRLSAYGGQTMLLALAGARGDVESIDLLDRGIFHAIAVLLVIDVIRRRKLNFAAGALIVFFMLSLWDLALNCASVWTGFTLFGAAYTFATREDMAPRTSLVLAFAACGAACTLRQNYLAPAGLFAALLLLGYV